MRRAASPEYPATRTESPSRLKRLAGKVALIATLFGGATLAVEAAAPAAALAEARPTGETTISSTGSTLHAQGNILLDCTNTKGCWGYIKVEKLRDFTAWNSAFNPRNYLMLSSPQSDVNWNFVAGHWMHDGANYVDTNCTGHGWYRTLVEAYNANEGDTGSANVGYESHGASAGISIPLGTGVRDYKATQSSTPIEAC